MQVLLLSGEAKGEVGLAQTPNCQRRVVEVSCVESKGPILNLLRINSFLPDGPRCALDGCCWAIIESSASLRHAHSLFSHMPSAPLFSNVAREFG